MDPSLSPTLSGLMQHVLASPWYVEMSQVTGYLGRRQDRHRAGLGCGAPPLGLEPVQLLVRRVHRPAGGPSRSRRRGPDPGGPPGSQRPGPADPPGHLDAAVPAGRNGRHHDAGSAARPAGRGDAGRPGRSVTALGGTGACATLRGVTVEGPPPPNAGTGAPDPAGSPAAAASTSATSPAFTAEDLVRLTGGRLLKRERAPDPRRRRRFAPRPAGPAVRRPARRAHRRPSLPRGRRRRRSCRAAWSRGRSRRTCSSGWATSPCSASPTGSSRSARSRPAGGPASTRWWSESPAASRRRPPRRRSPRSSGRGSGRSAPRATRTMRSACRSRCSDSAPSTGPPCSRWACTRAARSPTWPAWRGPGSAS